MAKTRAEVMASHSAAGPPPGLRAGAGAGRDKTETSAREENTEGLNGQMGTPGGWLHGRWAHCSFQAQQTRVWADAGMTMVTRLRLLLLLLHPQPHSPI